MICMLSLFDVPLALADVRGVDRNKLELDDYVGKVLRRIPGPNPESPTDPLNSYNRPRGSLLVV